jgi:transcriptional regulator with XRE-family HTH domain
MKPAPNVALRVAIVQSGRKQADIARSSRITETRFSHIVRGRLEPSAKERERIAKALQRSSDELFGHNEAVAS